MVGTLENPEWVGKDVCDLLGYESYSATLNRLPSDETCSRKLREQLQTREMVTVKEPGLYRLIFGSNRLAATPTIIICSQSE